MDKAEALEFIGLKEPISEQGVRDKYTERFNYFQMLYSNAPNKVVEQIQQQNLEKLKYVKKILLEDIDAKKKNFEKKNANLSPKVTEEPEKVESKAITGWLIVHTEDKKAATFNLYEGINYIGRKKTDEKAYVIIIDDDPFVSRTHAFIKCKESGGRFQFVLYDGDGHKPSVNGVFLNGKDVRIHQHCSLKENDTVQVGTTKLVLKIKKDDSSLTGKIEEVMQTGFIRTIDVNK